MWAELREIDLGLKPKRRTRPKRRRTAAGGLWEGDGEEGQTLTQPAMA
jgi:hypothetical protein